jgi:hypothetical protein
MAFLGIAFSQLGALWARHEVHSHSWSRLDDTAIVALTNVLCFAIFFLLKLMVFNRIFHVARPDDVETDLTLQEETAI